jgi:hypothetical protein
MGFKSVHEQEWFANDLGHVLSIQKISSYDSIIALHRLLLVLLRHKVAEWCCSLIQQRANRGVDHHRRHEFSEEGPAFARGDAPVLRPARQAGHLSDCRHAVDRQPRGQSAGRLPALPAAGRGRTLSRDDGSRAILARRIMSEPEFLLEFVVVAFDAPAPLGEIDQFGERDILRQGREPICGRLILVPRPFDQEPFLRARLARSSQPSIPQKSRIESCMR